MSSLEGFIGEVPLVQVSPTVFWMSFTDPDKPEGQQFLGGCLVDGATMEEALTNSHALGINPGGAVKTVGPIPREQVPLGGRFNALLSREDLIAMGPDWEGIAWTDDDDE